MVNREAQGGEREEKVLKVEGGEKRNRAFFWLQKEIIVPLLS